MEIRSLSGNIANDFPGEASQSAYVPTAKVLDHFEEEINVKLGGVAGPDGTMRKARILLLAGADLIQTMSVSENHYSMTLAKIHSEY